MAIRWMAPVLVCALATAGETRYWTQSEAAEFEKGVLKNLSLRSDGLLTLAPRIDERFDASVAYLWALARDSKGNLYAGGGPGAKLFRVDEKGQGKALAELEGLQIQAIAVDKSDRVYAATAPDGKVYRVDANGKSEVYYDPKAKYIWGLAFDRQGNLLVATGDKGELHRVTGAGQGSVLYKSDETHVRAVTVDADGNVIVGTEPGGLVIRVSPQGQGFVLYQAAKKEVTAVAVAPDGAIYAAAVGNKAGAPGLLVPALVGPAPSGVQPAPSAPGAQRAVVLPAPAPLPPPTAPAVAGGSEVYRIARDGEPRRVWSHASELVYAIGFDREGRALLGSGNKGVIYRIDSPSLSTQLLNTPPTQITALAAGPEGRLYAATGNVGKIYEIGPGMAAEGTLESEVYDAGGFSQFGRVAFHGAGGVAIATRSGNLERPGNHWSPWSNPVTTDKGARTNVPAARFIQYKATVNGSGELRYVEVAYLPKNVEPKVREIEITPANYKFPPPANTPPAPPTLNLPAMGSRTVAATVSLDPPTSTPGMTWARGWASARWLASDDNGDALEYKVEIRGAQEREWKLLKDKVKEKYISWDSTAFPDGEYRLRVTASDAPSNPRETALSAELVSLLFTIDNSPPAITGLTATRNGSRLTVRWKAADALNVIVKAEYSLNGGEWTVAPPVSKLSDSTELDYELVMENVPAGEQTIAVRVEDEFENQGTAKAVVQ